ncbi:replication initiator protein A [Flavonifractor plautii]|uniref:replication initiator protein A n=1 Tax=Flavonifractor plautii TaxID=292800 RepID=UPI001FA9479B|nr:replication initiator protein A [Flavonifractor plautii]
MGQTVSFDYFYGGQSDTFSYYRIPRLLITGQQFKGLSTDAKLLYGLMLDRMGLSARNGWYDELGRVYIYYPLDEVQADLNCGHDKATKLLSELDTGKGIGLIERVKQGQGRPAKIYVKQFTTTEIPQPPAPPPEPEEPNPRLPKNRSLDCGKPDFKTAENRKCRLRKIRRKL